MRTFLYTAGRSSTCPIIGSFILTNIPCGYILVDLTIRGFFYIYPILIALLLFATLFMIASITTNPGIIPKIIKSYETDPELFSIPSQRYLDEDDELKYLFKFKSIFTHTKYCSECHIYRPPRTVHCRDCNHCIEKYDHHCPFLGVCIGKFNYKYFICYLFFLTILAFYTIGICIFVTLKTLEETKVWQSLLRNLGELIIFPFSLIFSLSLFRLLAYHLYLIYLRQTTNENMKDIYKNVGVDLPYQMIYLRNRKTFSVDKYYLKIRKHSEGDESLLKSLLQKQHKSIHQKRKTSQTMQLYKIQPFDEIIQKI